MHLKGKVIAWTHAAQQEPTIVRDPESALQTLDFYGVRANQGNQPAGIGLSGRNQQAVGFQQK
jgi:hypothetical protein